MTRQYHIAQVICIIILGCSFVSGQPSQKISQRLLTELTDRDCGSLTLWVELTDKPVDLLQKIGAAETIVSEKAIERRKKVLPESNLLEYTDLPVNTKYISAIEKTGAKIRHISKWFNAVSVSASPVQLQQIIVLPFVKYLDKVENYQHGRGIEQYISMAKSSVSAQPANSYAFDYGDSFTQLNQIKVPEVHNLGFTGQGIIIGVLDAGFNNLAHEAFQSMNIIAKWDFVNNDPGVGDSTDQGSGSHGTATLSTIGGYKPGKLIGPAFNAKFILAKTENTYSETPIEEDNWIAAIEWADSIGVDITSTSLGYITFDPPFTSYSWQSMDGNTCRITKAADLAVKKGIAVFNSAGNEGMNNDHNTLGAPADGDSVVAIGAVDAANARVSFSSVGNTVDGRIKPDLMAMGIGVVTASSFSTNQYNQSSGTSFSCPLAAGAAAVILSARPFLTPMQLRDAMRSTASNHNWPNREYGWGIINTLAALQYTPVPAELTSFSAKADGNSIVLNWTVSIEHNVRGYEIQSSVNRTDFTTAGWIPCSKSDNGKNSYSYTGNFSGSGKTYYRLKIVNFDGSYIYSDLIEALSAPVTFALSQNYPNPFNPETKIQFSLPVVEHVTLKVYDALGRLTATLLEKTMPAGLHSVTWTPAANAAGVYLYELNCGSRREIRKMTYLK